MLLIGVMFLSLHLKLNVAKLFCFLFWAKDSENKDLWTCKDGKCMGTI